MFKVIERIIAMGMCAIILAISGCATKPYTLNTPITKSNELANFERDLDACKMEYSVPVNDSAMAADAVANERSKEDAESSSISTTFGALSAKLYPNSEYRQHVIRCMRDMGYNMAD